ncbi:MAG: peptidoglycan DD-metalloendopeptidase family protein [Candidatus Omnitrophica bacterium]|nr:peptidoglycan DD-metalloendopeptidase family protein [Candidatus Omnitrophota bacterium]
MAQAVRGIASACVVIGSVLGCATTSAPYRTAPQALPTLQGSYHRVRLGETLWRIARSYGLDPQTLAAANRLPDAATLAVGQQLFIPLPKESNQFLWPVRGTLRTSGGAYGVDIMASPGNLVRASRSGRVTVATKQLSGWGKTVVLDHWDGYLSIYSGLDQILVVPGAELRQGVPLGSSGANAVHFEIRYGPTPKNTLSLLPTG